MPSSLSARDGGALLLRDARAGVAAAGEQRRAEGLGLGVVARLGDGGLDAGGSCIGAAFEGRAVEREIEAVVDALRDVRLEGRVELVALVRALGEAAGVLALFGGPADRRRARVAEAGGAAVVVARVIGPGVVVGRSCVVRRRNAVAGAVVVDGVDRVAARRGDDEGGSCGRGDGGRQEQEAVLVDLHGRSRVGRGPRGFDATGLRRRAARSRPARRCVSVLAPAARC